MATAIAWLRRDLRVRDNAALHHAAVGGRRVVAVFLVADAQWAQHDWGAPRRGFLRRTLEVLAQDLAARGIPFVVESAPRFADAPERLAAIATAHHADEVHANAEPEIDERRRDDAVGRRLAADGRRLVLHHDDSMLPLDAVRTGTGGVYTVFTPFSKALLARLEAEGVPGPWPAPPKQGDPRPPTPIPSTVGAADDGDRADLWPAGEAEAHARLERFVRERLARYRDRRDLPAVNGTSTLSPYLALGAISVRDCLRAAMAANDGRLRDSSPGADTWIKELAWREFYRGVCVGFPRVSMGRPFRLETERVRWRDDDTGFDAWAEASTGIPIVDAAMRQLLRTGWMHNRLRMIVASFLTKNLLVDWRRGERFFMKHLVDGDFPSNNGGWQWSASTGTDAAPYFRVFNPVSQARKFDPDGAFVRRFLPELAALDDATLHEPWTAPPLVRRGLDYPEPIVDLKSSRARAIEAFKQA